MARLSALLSVVLCLSLSAQMHILLPPQPTAPEKTAAAQLEKYLPLLSGAPLSDRKSVV